MIQMTIHQSNRIIPLKLNLNVELIPPLALFRKALQLTTNLAFLIFQRLNSFNIKIIFHIVE